MQFKTDHTVHSWEYLPESTRLCNINSFRVYRSGENFDHQEGLEQAEYL